MTSKIVLVSDEKDFFDYIRTKLELRKTDTLEQFNFATIPEHIHEFGSAVFIINSENCREKTLDLLKLLPNNPSLVFSYNEDDVFKRKCLRAGAYDFIHLLISDSDIKARILPLLRTSSILEKNIYYRNLLAEKELLKKDNDVYLDYNSVIDKELEKLSISRKKATFLAISPADKTKFLINTQIVESIILNSIRKNDILMNYAPHKYFLILFDSNIESAQKIWNKIASQLPEEFYAGFCNITNQKREQLVNEALNKLHTEINKNLLCEDINLTLGRIDNNSVGYSNFKMFKKEFCKNFEKVVTPAFYQVKQRYLPKMINVKIEDEIKESNATFSIISSTFKSKFAISAPGYSIINIDISLEKNNTLIEQKRISIAPQELEQTLLSDLLEQFVLEFKKGCE